MNLGQSRVWIGVALIGLMGISFLFGVHQHASPHDDAYITYRYAHNIALGRGFVYNPGEAVLGTTTPLYTLLLAGLSLIWPDLPLVSHAISVLAWMGCVPIMYGIGRSGSKAVGIAAASLVAVNPLFLDALGMETALYVLLILLTFYFLLQKRPVWAALCAGLTFLVRWDGILVVGVFLLAEMFKSKRASLRAGLLSAGIIVPWLIYSYATFGSVFPNSFLAKVGQGWNEGLGGAEIGSFADGLLIVARAAYAQNRLFAVWPVLAILGAVCAVRDKVPWWPVLLWTATYLGGYVALGVLRFPWYYPPLVPAVALLTTKGAEGVAEFISARLGMGDRRAALIALIWILPLIPTADWLIETRRPEMGAHNVTYVEVGRWLRDDTPPGSSVAMIEIGIIGYYSDRTVVDTMGLVSPEMVGHLDTWVQTLQFAVNHYWPDYVVGLERTAWEAIVAETWFQEAYALETQIENSADPVAPVSIYRRREGLPPHEFDVSYGKSVAYDRLMRLDEFQVVEEYVETGGRLHVQLNWEAQADIGTDYRLQFDLLSASDGQPWTLASGLQPMRGGNPTHHWMQGDLVVDAHTLTVPDAVRTGPYLLRLVIVGPDGPVGALDIEGAAVSHVAVGPIQIGSSLPDDREPVYPVAAILGHSFSVTGYDLEPMADHGLSVTLYWQAVDDIVADYTVFVHVLSHDGGLVAQSDSPPVLPTSLWVPRIQVTDAHTVLLPAARVSDVYQIRIGMYHWPGLERLPIVESGCLDAADDALLVGYISLSDAQGPDDSACPDLHWIEIAEE